jgi:hypothetical protein
MTPIKPEIIVAELACIKSAITDTDKVPELPDWLVYIIVLVGLSFTIYSAVRIMVQGIDSNGRSQGGGLSEKHRGYPQGDDGPIANQGTKNAISRVYIDSEIVDDARQAAADPARKN